MFKTSPFTLKWRSLYSRPASGNYTNASYRDSNFNVVNATPSWPPRDLWNNIWYNSEADFRTGFFYDVFNYSTSQNNGGAFYGGVYAGPAYVYYAPEYGCCWCECSGGGGTVIPNQVWADGYYNYATWGNVGECRSCRNNHWSNRYQDLYQPRRYFGVYSRYSYTDHSQPLGNMYIYKDYYEQNDYVSTDDVDR
jgi:hypothetical protein